MSGGEATSFVKDNQSIQTRRMILEEQMQYIYMVEGSQARGQIKILA